MTKSPPSPLTKHDLAAPLAIAFCASLIFAWFAWRFARFVFHNTVKAIPTCIQLTIAETNTPMRAYSDLLQGVLRQLDHPQNRGSTDTAIVAGSDDVYVFWDYPSHGLSHQKSTVDICQWNPSSIRWQDFARQIQAETMKSYGLVSAKLQRNPAMYSCGDHCLIDVPVPLDFNHINAYYLGGRPVRSED
jgi:hypothetical protein